MYNYTWLCIASIAMYSYVWLCIAMFPGRTDCSFDSCHVKGELLKLLEPDPAELDKQPAWKEDNWVEVPRYQINQSGEAKSNSGNLWLIGCLGFSIMIIIIDNSTRHLFIVVRGPHYIHVAYLILT